MTERLKITETVFDFGGYSVQEKWTLSEFMSMLSDAAKAAPCDPSDITVRLELELPDYDGSPCIIFDATYERDETDAEAYERDQKDRREEQERNRQREMSRRAMFEELKREFEGKKGE